MTKPILECNGIAAGYVKGLNILQGVDTKVLSSQEMNRTFKCTQMNPNPKCNEQVRYM